MLMTLVLMMVPYWCFYSHNRITIQLVNDMRSTSGKISMVEDFNVPDLPVTSCTIFTVKSGGNVFFGGNEDEGGSRRNTRMWFVPASDETYGAAYFGFIDNLPGGDDIDGLAIGGINTEGLCFDANGVMPPVYIEPNADGLVMSGIIYWEVILRECATVKEVIQWHETHNMGGWWGNQVHWADASGDAVVISGCPDGELAFTRIESNYLVSTNFNLANTSHGYYPCQRYNLVTAKLDYYIKNGSVTLDNCRTTLYLVHSPATSRYIGTVYTTIYDLKARDIYLFIHGNYTTAVKINLIDVLEQGNHEYRISEDLLSSLPTITIPLSNPVHSTPAWGFIESSIAVAVYYWFVNSTRIRKKKDT